MSQGHITGGFFSSYCCCCIFWYFLSRQYLCKLKSYVNTSVVGFDMLNTKDMSILLISMVAKFGELQTCLEHVNMLARYCKVSKGHGCLDTGLKKIRFPEHNPKNRFWYFTFLLHFCILYNEWSTMHTQKVIWVEAHFLCPKVWALSICFLHILTSPMLLVMLLNFENSEPQTFPNKQG